MITVAVSNSSKESWRQNQRTNATIRFTTVPPLVELTFLGRMGCSGAPSSLLPHRTDAPDVRFTHESIPQEGSKTRRSGPSAFRWKPPERACVGYIRVINF